MRIATANQVYTATYLHGPLLHVLPQKTIETFNRCVLSVSKKDGLSDVLNIAVQISVNYSLNITLRYLVSIRLSYLALFSIYVILLPCVI